MATFNVSVSQLPVGLKLDDLHDDAEFKPCAAGAEESIGFRKDMGRWSWGNGDWQFLDILLETRKVPKLWFEAELRRRTLPNMTAQDYHTLKDNVRAELWHKIIPDHHYGFLAYHKPSGLFVANFQPRKVHKAIRHLCDHLNTRDDFKWERGWSAEGFDAYVRALVQDRVEDNGLTLGANIEFAEGSGGTRKVIAFRNYDQLVGDENVAEVMLRCKMVASAGFMLDKVKEGKDDFTATPYGGLAITEIPNKDSSDKARDLIRASRVREIVVKLKENIAPHIPDTGEEIE